MTLNNYLEFGSEEIVIRLKPKLTGRNAAWSGDVDTTIDCFEDNPLSAKGLSGIDNFHSNGCSITSPDRTKP